MEEMHSQDEGKDSEPFSLHLYVCTNPEAHWTQNFWVFMEASLHDHD